MKKIFILILVFPLVFGACKKDDVCPYTESTAIAPTSEKTYLHNSLSSDPAIVEDSSGVFYKIVQQGSGTNPSICSNMTVKYTGTIYPSGAFFDGTNSSANPNPTANLTLGGLIAGWQHVMPNLKTGGKITLYIPPSLGYGSQNIRDENNNLLIPGNSYLKFEIELVNVQ